MLRSVARFQPITSLVAGALLFAAGAPAALAAPADRPDLVIALPSAPSTGQVAPVYVDRFERPGRVLYRFDSIIANRGGTLDIFRDGPARPAVQAIWAGGNPPPGSEPDAGAPAAPSADVTLEDRSGSGASFSYVVEPDHAHWHFARVARYELLVPGGAARVSDKVGFCLYDSFDTTGPSIYFPEPDWGSGQPTWCAFDEPGAAVVRMGLSPGASDRYRSQRHWQWVDITGLTAGAYTLRGTANPAGYLLESNTANNVLDQARTIPGARVSSAAASTRTGRRVGIELRGAVVAPEIPARRSGGCLPQPTSEACYIRTGGGGPLDFALVRAPEHGSVTIADAGGLTARATYTPKRGFSGRDSFAYVATDARGLTSAPATASVTVRKRRAARRRPIAGAAIRRIRGRRYAIVRLRATARVRGVVRRRKSMVRRLRARRLAPGRHRIALGRLRRRGPHTLVLRAGPGWRQRVARDFRVGRVGRGKPQS
jgi:Lysyl oxidase/Bacterial Ig domain